MMTDKSDIVAKQLPILRQNFARKLNGRVANLHKNWRTLQADWQPDLFFEFYRNTHTLVGSSLTFKFVQFGEKARQLENVLELLFKSDRQLYKEQSQPVVIQPDEKQSQQIEMLLDELKHTVENLENIDLAPDDKPALYSPTVEEPALIFLVEDDIELATHISKQVETFGYSVKILTGANELLAVMAHQIPQAIIMDIMLPEGKLAGPKIIEEIQQKYQQQHIPFICISARDDLEARLTVTRVGSHAYMTKPIEVSKLVEWLDSLTTKTPDEPYRILIVDDDAELARHHAILLENVGMQVQVCIELMTVLEQLRQFLPELILMDIYMPQCTGTELTKVIRQLDILPSIPIVYLSTEHAMVRQLDAILQGGDGFLTKPILANDLIRVVSYHVKNFRQLRRLMVRDSLTGLLNHSHILEQLDIEVGLADRTNTPVSLVMLDIDHFKQINDTYGHNIGDNVLKTLARFLKQRFRFTDYIGRCGGEEFAIILPNTDGLTAKKIMENCRAAFSQVSHQAQQQKFQITFSSGIAYYPQYKITQNLIEAADAALYESKNTGRNRVTLATA